MSWDKARSLIESYSERQEEFERDNLRGDWLTTPYGSYAELIEECNSQEDNQQYQQDLETEEDQNITDGDEHKLNFVVAMRRTLRRQFAVLKGHSVPRRPLDYARFGAQEFAFHKRIAQRMDELHEERDQRVTGGG